MAFLPQGAIAGAMGANRPMTGPSMQRPVPNGMQGGIGPSMGALQGMMGARPPMQPPMQGPPPMPNPAMMQGPPPGMMQRPPMMGPQMGGFGGMMRRPAQSRMKPQSPQQGARGQATFSQE